jgi:hypothetical protein
VEEEQSSFTKPESAVPTLRANHRRKMMANPRPNIRTKTWERQQAEAAIKRALQKWGTAYDKFGNEFKWAIVAVELVNLVYLQQTNSPEVKTLQRVILEARALTENI